MKFKQLTATLLLILTVILSGCNRTEEQLVSFIPVDRPCSVGTVNLERFCSDFDIKTTDGSIVWPEYLKWLSSEIPAEKTKEFTEFLAPLDRSYMVYYTDATDYMKSFLIARIANREEFDIVLAEQRKTDPVAADGFELSEFNSFNCIVKGNLLWITRMSIAELKEIIERAGKTNLSKLDGVCNALGNDGFMNIAVMTDPGTDPDGQTSEWNVGSFRIDDQLLAGDFKSMLGDGKPNSNEYLSPVSTDFLRYMPEGLNVVAAVGRNEKPVSADEIIRRVEIMLPSGPNGRQIRQIITIVAPYIANINGTAALGLSINGSESGAVLMARMEQEQINNTISSIASQLSAFGLSPVTDPHTGAVTINIPGVLTPTPITVTMRNADGNLLITTFDADGTYNNSYAPLFNGKHAGVLVSLPISTMFDRIPYGFRLEIQNEGAETRCRVNFTGSDRPFTETLGEIFRLIYEQ